MKVIDTTKQQKSNAEKKSIEDHHAILFMLGANKYEYGKLIKDTKMTS